MNKEGEKMNEEEVRKDIKASIKQVETKIEASIKQAEATVRNRTHKNIDYVKVIIDKKRINYCILIDEKPGYLRVYGSDLFFDQSDEIDWIYMDLKVPWHRMKLVVHISREEYVEFVTLDAIKNIRKILQKGEKEKGVILNIEKDYFGHCLFEDHKNPYTLTKGTNGHGADAWFYCHICKIKWCVGSGIFSTPDEEDLGCTKEEYYSKNAIMLMDYEDFTDKGRLEDLEAKK